MLRSALAARFGLAMHREIREIPVYALLIARRDGSFGPRLRRSTADQCQGPARPFPDAADAPAPIPDHPCGSGMMIAGHASARGMDVSTLVTRLGTTTDRVLVDRTGLTGNFEWDLQWTPDALTPDAKSSSATVPLVTALREQLGLRLEAQREPVEVLVIDRVERPRPD